MKKKVITTVIGLFLSCFIYGMLLAEQPNYIRVNIIKGVSSLRLHIEGFYEVRSSCQGQILYRGKDLNTTVTVYNGRILMGSINLRTNKAFIEARDQLILINGRTFRGAIEFIREDNKYLSVVNYAELEDYIKGILYHEASHYWPYEALKAQAVASRTYAVYQRQQSKNKDYDVTSDIYSQVYGGRTSERDRTNKAVDMTKGQILVYREKVFPAYFHATCGGHTEDASLLWDIDIAPLKGVKCGFCKESPHSSWHYVLTKTEIKNKLSGTKYKISSISDVVISGRDKSGRVTNLRILASGKDVVIPAKDFRHIIGPNIIRSTNFSVRSIKNDVIFEGIGWGHGVGMCQWGAYFMAKNGDTYDKILGYYYSGSQISSIADK